MKDKLNLFLKFLRRNKALTRTLSLVLSIILLFYVIPTTLFVEAAQALDGITNRSQEETKASVNNTDIGISEGLKIDPFEDITLREESVKHFRLSDGNYVAAQYNYPVHSLDENGDWQDIDNALADTGSEFANSNARIKFAKKINGSSELFALHDGNTKLTLTLINARKGVVGEVTNNTDAETDTELQKMMNLEKISSSIIYREILDGVDIEYIAYSKNVKENIIVKEKGNSYSYSFELKLNGLTPTLTEDGNIVIRTDDSSELMYIIPAPIVFDADGSYAPEGVSEYTLTHKNGKKYILTVSVDDEWMNSEDRAYPVTVDPAVTNFGSVATDVNISTSYPSSTSDSVTEITVMDNTYKMLMHWKTTQLPSIPTSAKIIDASIYLSFTSGYGAYVGAYEVDTDWDNTLTWNKYSSSNNPQGRTLVNLIDYVRLLNPGTYSWNITELVEKWYKGYNYGVAFAIIPKSTTYATFKSSESPNASTRPYFVISYRDMKGLESYWPYSSHSAGNAGSGNINLANGQLIFTIPTLTTTDSIFSYTPYLIYDSSMANKFYYDQESDIGVNNPITPKGFTLSVCETIIAYTSDATGKYYVYSDPDGTEHNFYNKSENIYADEDGLGLTLTVESSGSISVENSAKEIKYFEKVTNSEFGTRWRLGYIEDVNGNRLVFTYENLYYSQFKPTKISLLPKGNTQQIDLLELRYNGSGYLNMVYNPAAKTAVVFRYSNTYSGLISSTASQYLRQVDYAIGNSSVTSDNWNAFALDSSSNTNITIYDSAEYTYNSQGYITEVKNAKSDQSIRYTWMNKKVTDVTEYASESRGNTIGLSYTTDFSQVYSYGSDGVFSPDDIKNIYVLDTFGRCTSVYSTSGIGEDIYGASSYTYDTQENSKNSIKQQAVIGGSSVNYLINGSFEQRNWDVPYYWDITGNVFSTSLTSVDGSFLNSVTFCPYADSTAAISQSLSLDPGTYTLSMPIHFQNCEGITGVVSVIDYQTSATLHTESISPLLISDDIFFSTTFTINDATDYKKVIISISFTSPTFISVTPRIEIDSVMLSKTLAAGKFNLLEYGSFEHTLLGWNGNASSITTSYWVNEDGNAISVIETYESEGKCAVVSNDDG